MAYILLKKWGKTRSLPKDTWHVEQNHRYNDEDANNFPDNTYAFS